MLLFFYEERRNMKERQPVNYIYFGILFVILSAVHVYHIFLIENATGFYRFFYTIYALGQCAVEVAALMGIGYFLAPRFPRIFKSLFVISTFLLLLIHMVDFPLIRIMGMTIWYVFDFIRAESFENFVEMLLATHVSITSWMLAGLVVLLIPLLGIVFFRSTDKLSRKRPVLFSYPTVGVSLFLALFFLSMFDFKMSKIVALADEGQFLKVLPWKSTFFSSSHPRLEVGRLSPEPSEKEYLSYLQTLDLKTAKKPNIFLFVVESLREDFLTPAVAPALSRFKEDNIAFPHSLAAANGTQLSWFSIFSGVYPFYWEKRPTRQWQSGSLPLQILKKAGYQVHVYSASRLQYYQMDERLFGKRRSLADTLQIFGQDEERENHENDAECIATLIEDLTAYEEGHVFIVFLESTHFGYSWPHQEALHPDPKEMDYLNLTCSNAQIEGVKNRYRNAIHFIDGLFGQFFEKLKSVPGGEEAVVVFTGDHGEEFFEQGRVFHASNLNTMQTHVPLYFRLGTALPSRERKISSHLDIFPTILDHVLGHTYFESWFDGESILRPSKKKFAVSTRYNASRSPFEFLIHTGKDQLIVRFDKPYNIFESHSLKIISRKDANDRPLAVDLDRIKDDFKTPLEMLFKD
jgi:glucan phosphoethanolaminetransferase (alkaline phosphatase superfamily)